MKSTHQSLSAKNSIVVPEKNEEILPPVEHSDLKTDFYKTLGLSENATYDEIKKKWLKLSLIYHPDKCDGSDEMFRKINLAYKVLSNPENRKKYNDSLAKTHDQLKDTERDVDYHVNKDFLIEEVDDKNNVIKKFNLNKFLDSFQTNNHEFAIPHAPIPVTKPTTQSLNDLMAAREQELESFKSNLRSELPNPRQNTDDFNFIFTQLYRPGTDIDVVDDESTKDFATFVRDVPTNDLQDTNKYINDLSRSIKTNKIVLPENTSGSPISMEEANARMKAYKDEGLLIDETLRTVGNYKILIDDTEKVVLTDDLYN